MLICTTCHRAWSERLLSAPNLAAGMCPRCNGPLEPAAAAIRSSATPPEGASAATRALRERLGGLGA